MRSGAARPGVVAVGRRERAAGRRLDLVPQPLGRLDQQPTDDHRRPRRDGRPGVGDERGVLRRELDRLERHAERVGDELREDRLGPLAHLGRGGQDADRALGGQLERGDRGELDLAGAGEPGAVPGEREPDAAGHPLAPGPQRRARDRAGTRSPHAFRVVARAQALELAGLGGPLEDLLAGHAVAQDLAGRGRVAEDVDVPPPDLERADLERLGDPVEVGLGRELGLRRPEPAKRAVRRRVRPRRAGADADVRAAVRAAGVDRAARQDDRGQRAVRAAVHHDLDVLGDEPAVARSPRSGGGRSPGGAWSSRRGPRGGRRSSAPGGRPSRPGARRGAR